jgi:hypothetical protein
MKQEHTYPKVQKLMEKLIAIAQLPKNQQKVAIKKLIVGRAAGPGDFDRKLRARLEASGRFSRALAPLLRGPGGHGAVRK